MRHTDLVLDIDGAAALIETYNIAGLVWPFKDCPLKELSHYVSNGKEEFVVISSKLNDYLSHRLIFPNDIETISSVNFIVILKFHPAYNIYIVLSPQL